MLLLLVTGERMMNAGLLESRDIQDAVLPVPPQPGQPAELQPLYDGAVAKCREAMAWYASHRKTRRLRGRVLRISAILFGALASLTPIFVQLADRADPRHNLWASVFAVLGATCVGLDNYLGSSTGWMRYIGTYFELGARLELMQMQWARQALAPELPAQKEQLGLLLELLQGFISDVNAIIQKETQEGMAEFKSHLLMLEQRTEAQRASLAAASVTAAKHGALKVQVENAVALRGGAWKVHVGTARALDGSGNHARVAMGLAPGQYRIRLEAEKDGGPYSPEDVVLIEPGATTTYTFKVA